jgi:hypothetical protein
MRLVPDDAAVNAKAAPNAKRVGHRFPGVICIVTDSLLLPQGWVSGLGRC